MTVQAVVGRALRETGAALKQAGGMEVSQNRITCTTQDERNHTTSSGARH